jgi:exodeoxyribonuclease X
MTIIRVIDFETTGTEPPSQICEVGICDFDLVSKSVLHPRDWLCSVIEIPPEVRSIHHISKNDCDGWDEFNSEKLDDETVTAFAAHNSDFECKFFTPKKPMICTYKSALRVWPDAPSHSNGALRYWLQDQGLIAPDHEKTMPSHRAGPDAYVTAHLLLALFNTGVTGKQMVAWTKEPRLLPTCPIGKFRGMKWSDVESGFLSWMLKQPTMEEDLKWNAMQEIARRSKGIEV